MWEKIADAVGPLFDEVVRYPVKFVITALTVTAAAAGLTAALGGDSVAVIFTLSCGGGVAIVLFIAATLRKIRGMRIEVRKLRTSTGVLDRYIEMTTQLVPESFTIADWDESVTVKKHGDTTIERWITITAGGDDLISCCTANFQTSRMTDRQRSRVRVKAHEFEGNPRTIGAPYEITDKWEGSKQTIFIHFRQPLPPGRVARIWVRWVWPGFYKSLIDGEEPEPVEWKMSRRVDRIKSSLIFASDCGIDETRNFSVSPLLESPAPTQQRQPDGSISIEVEYRDVPADSHLGYILDSNDPVA